MGDYENSLKLRSTNHRHNTLGANSAAERREKTELKNVNFIFAKKRRLRIDNNTMDRWLCFKGENGGSST